MSLEKLLDTVKNEQINELERILAETYSSSEIEANAQNIFLALQVSCSKNSEQSKAIAARLLSSTIITGANNIILEKAVENNNTDIVKLLLNNESVRKNAHTNKNWALQQAAALGNLELGKLLLEQPKVRKNAATAKNAALSNAAFGNHIDFVKLLLEIEEVRKNVAIEDNQALRKALKNNSMAVVRYLLTFGEVQKALSEDPKLNAKFQEKKKKAQEDPFHIKLIEGASLEIAQSKHEIYENISPRLKSLLPNIDEEALATFAAIVAEIQFDQHGDNKEITESVLESANAKYQMSPVPTWPGLVNVQEFADELNLKTQRKSSSKFK